MQPNNTARSLVKHTPTVSSTVLTDLCGGEVMLKAENLQRTGSFKIRGALNKLHALGESCAQRGHCRQRRQPRPGFGLCGACHGVPCEIFVPSGASLSKIAACKGYGGTVIEGGDTLDDAVAAAHVRSQAGGLAFCHPFDDIDVITGQATLGLELFSDVSDPQHVIIPLGGGGLASGVAIALKLQNPSIRVTAVQVDSCAPYLNSTVPGGAIVTLADGIAVKRPGATTRPLVERWIDEIVVVDEDMVADAMMLMLERGRLVVEGAGAVGVAALLSGRITPARRGQTCVVLSGGNVDLGVLPGLVRRNETRAGRRLIVFARISDRPGGLAKLLSTFARSGANLIEVEHVRDGVDLHVRETGVHVVLEVKGTEHAALCAGRRPRPGLCAGRYWLKVAPNPDALLAD